MRDLVVNMPPPFTSITGPCISIIEDDINAYQIAPFQPAVSRLMPGGCAPCACLP